jgi:WD40 repeat protein
MGDFAMPRSLVLVALFASATVHGQEIAPTPKPLLDLTAHDIGSQFVRFTPDGKKLLSRPAVYGNPAAWDVATGKRLSDARWPDALSPDGKLAAWVTPRHGLDRTGAIVITEAATNKELYRIADTSKAISHTSPGTPHFAPDGKTLYYFYTSPSAYGSEYWLRAVDADTGNNRRDIVAHHFKSMCELRYSPDGKRFATSSGTDVLIFESASGKQTARLAGHTKDVRQVAWSPDSLQLVSVAKDNSVRLWDIATGKLVRPFEVHTWVVLGVAFARDGKHVISASLDETLRIWNTTSGKQLAAYRPLTPTIQPENAMNGRGILSIDLSPNGKLLAVGGYDRSVKVWEVSSLIPK